MSDTLVCPKCGRAMLRGHLPDNTYGHIVSASWEPGDPEARRFVGGIKANQDNQVPMVAYRCGGCGFVELYAPTP